MNPLVAILSLSLALSGCASNRVLSGVILGGGAGAVGGSALSPNKPSRPYNALIFGLTGALLGGALAYLSGEKEPKRDTQALPLKLRLDGSSPGTEFSVVPQVQGQLPAFLKKRLTNVVIEEIPLPPEEDEDGTLHEPHKAYRIKRAPQLLPSPWVSEAAKPEQKK